MVKKQEKNHEARQKKFTLASSPYLALSPVYCFHENIQKSQVQINRFNGLEASVNYGLFF